MTDQDDTRQEFGEAVSMTPAELKKWLASGESKSVGHDSGDMFKGLRSGQARASHW